MTTHPFRNTLVSLKAGEAKLFGAEGEALVGGAAALAGAADLR
jgi:hypothetical protein